MTIQKMWAFHSSGRLNNLMTVVKVISACTVAWTRISLLHMSLMTFLLKSVVTVRLVICVRVHIPCKQLVLSALLCCCQKRLLRSQSKTSLHDAVTEDDVTPTKPDIVSDTQSTNERLQPTIIGLHVSLFFCVSELCSSRLILMFCLCMCVCVCPR